MKKAILLIRISTGLQHLDSQTDDLKNFVIQKGYEPSYLIEDTESGYELTEEERNGLNKMKDIIEKDSDVKAVFCWEISRLARNEKVLHSIKDYLIERKINLYIKDKNIVLLDENTGETNEAAEMFFSIFGYFASQEVKQLKRRTSRAKRYLTKSGKFAGGRHLFGYKIGKDNYFEIDENDGQIVTAIFTLYSKGKMVGEIIDYIEKMYLKKFTKIQIYNILKNISYTGGTPDKPYPILISKELFNKCREVSKSNNVTGSKAKNIYLCHSIIKCFCGANFIAVPNNCQYVCNRFFHKKTTTIQCTSDKKSINLNIAETIAWRSAKMFLHSFQVNERENAITNYKKSIEENTKLLDNISNRLTKVDKEKKKLTMLVLDDLIDDNQYAELKAKIASKSKEIEADKVMYQQNIKDAQEALKRLETMEQMAYQERKKLGDKIQEKQYTDKEMFDIVHQFVKAIRVTKIENVEVVTVTSYSNTKHTYAYYPMKKELYQLLLANKMNTEEKTGRYVEVKQEEWLHRFPSPIEILQNRKKLNK